MAAITNEYRQTNDYKYLKAAVLDMSPGLPEYLVDSCISLHIAKPLMYRDKKLLRKDMNKQKKPVSNEVLEGLVTVENEKSTVI